MSDSLNTASGRITIDTSQAEQAPAKMSAVAQGINQAFSQVNASSAQAASGITMLSTAMRGLAGAFGISFGVQGVKQLADMAISATEVATAYNRQLVAARGLAGSQAELNHLLAVYQEASGGAVDKATALANVTKLMSVGFADNAEELQKFTTIIRGISVAMGQSQDYVTQNLILELFSQRGQRLDQLGLEYDKVKAKADQLAAADANLTTKQAYQNAVLEEAQKKFGDLAKSPEGARTGLEQVGAAAKDATVAFGEVLGPTVNLIATGIVGDIDRMTLGMEAFKNLVVATGQYLNLIKVPTPTGPIASRSGLGAGLQQAPTAMEYQVSAGENAIRLDWAKGIKEQTKQADDQIAQENEDYNQQRLKSEEDYYKESSDQAADFGRQRLREEQDLTDSIGRLQRDSAQREQQQAEDLARSIADARANSEEKIADARKDSAKQLAELDKNYEKERLKRAKELSDQLLDAAGNLDAKQVYELQRNAAKQDEEAKSAHDDQRKKLQEQLDERIDDERKSLAKSIKQQQESYDRQLRQGRDADAQRIQDMKDDLKKRQEQEDIDYGIRMGRMARDHDDQLAEMDRVHNDRITQIQTQGDADLAALADQHKRQIDELLGHHSKYNAELKKADDDALKEFTRLTNPVRVWLKNPTAPLVTPGMANGSSVAPFSSGGNSYSSSSHSFSPNVTVTIQGGSSLTQKQIDDAVHDALIRTWEDMGQ